MPAPSTGDLQAVADTGVVSGCAGIAAAAERGTGGSGGIAALFVGASRLATLSLVPVICLSMKSWFKSRIARVSAATTALRLSVSSLSCFCSPDKDQLVEPFTV